MKLKRLNSNKEFNLNIAKYYTDWDKTVGSKFQRRVKDFFFPYWKSHVVCEELRIPGSLLRIDLINFTRRWIVETNGNQHREYNQHFHQNRSNYLNQIKRDFEKESWANLNQFKYIEIYEEDMPLNKEWFKVKYDLEL